MSADRTDMRPDGQKATMPQQSGLRPFLRGFARKEEGSLMIFGVYVLVLILMVAGIGVDVMRFERDRAELQATLDRAVLAAANLDQIQNPQHVVADYLDKAGLSQYLSSVTVDQGVSYRIVSATANGKMDTQFMRMTGVKSLDIPAVSTAEERVDGVEISLVLDVSGSMNSNSRLKNLKVAAKEFVDTMVTNTEAGKLSISIVPYATQVSLPTSFLNKFNISAEHAYSNCVNFNGSDFNQTAITQSQPLKRTMHFDPWGNYDGRSYNPMRLVTQPVCESDTAREVAVMTGNASQLKTFINNLSAKGNTSIDVGMKWGTALLDPSLRPVITQMIGEGKISSDFSARPHLYTDNDSLKVIVLMTDGDNTSQFYIKDGYRTGASNIWWNAEEKKYSVYHPGNNSYFWPHDKSWNAHAYGNGGATTYCSRYRWNGSCSQWQTVPPEPGEATALDYPDLWAHTSLLSNLYSNYYPWMNSSAAANEWFYGVYDDVNAGTKDIRTKAICDAAKAERIIVFTIGFEAPNRGKAVLKDCASSDSHYFDVKGLEISDAFSAIASSIRKLRLTQ